MVRPYKNSDLERIMEIGNLAWQNIYAMFRECYGDDLFNVLVPDKRTQKGMQIKLHAKKRPEWIFVCEEKGRTVGFITFYLDFKRKVGEILNNAVDPVCGLKGIGQQMYRAVLDHFREKGMVYATVNTGLDEAHAPARRAYERVGFNMRHDETRYYMKL